MDIYDTDHSDNDASDYSSSSRDPMPTLLQALPSIQEPRMTFKWWPYPRWSLIFAAVMVGYMLGHLTSEVNLAGTTDEKSQHECGLHISNIELDAASDQQKIQLENLIDEKIRKAIDLFQADKLGRIDYALESNGAYILSIFDTKSYSSKVMFDLFGILTIEPPSNPAVILRPGTMPGECYAFSGQRGKFLIRLSIPTEITAVTLEHASRTTLIDPRSAPRQFVVYGVSEDQQKKDFLGLFTFDIDSEESLKTFSIKSTTLHLTHRLRIYYNVELHIVSNHGHPDYTCLYRFRVHGKHLQLI